MATHRHFTLHYLRACTLLRIMKARARTSIRLIARIIAQLGCAPPALRAFTAFAARARTLRHLAPRAAHCAPR
jgi:hypothetical protein